MPLFSDETLLAVRSIPLYDIVRPVVDLSRSGRNWRGLSPFSNERSPSFYVLTDRNFFKCHSTGLAGDGIRFVQETEKLTFPEAVETLAERFNISVTFRDGGGPNPEIRGLKQALLDIHEYARDYYHRAFMADHPVSASIRQYWVESRGFTLSLAEDFSIGFAPADSRKLLELLQQKGFSREALAKSGLFNPGRNERDLDSWYFMFRGRLMIPIRNVQGQVVAFTARQLDITPQDHASWKAKYINSPETHIFQKSRLLFNLDRAKEATRASGRLLLVEGQLDALRCWSEGIQDAVAPQGTSITEDQLQLARRYVDRLDVLFDSDAAGGRAVLRLLPMAFKAGLQVQVFRLPDGSDPDDLLRREGREALNRLPPSSGLRHAGQTLMAEAPPSPEHQAKVLHELFEMLSACPSAVVRDGYFQEAVEVTGSSSVAARKDFEVFFAAQSPLAGPMPAPEKKTRKVSAKGLTNIEADLLWSILKNAAWAEPLAQVIDHQWIRIHTTEGKVLSRILAQATVDHLEGHEDIQLLLETDAEREVVAHLIVDDRPASDLQDFINDLLAAMVRRHSKERVAELDQKIHQISGSGGDSSSVRDLLNERRGILKLIQNGPFPTAFLPPTSHP